MLPSPLGILPGPVQAVRPQIMKCQDETVVSGWETLKGKLNIGDIGICGSLRRRGFDGTGLSISVPSLSNLETL